MWGHPLNKLEKRQAEMKERMATPTPSITAEQVTLAILAKPSESLGTGEPIAVPEIRGNAERLSYSLSLGCRSQIAGERV